MGAPNCHGRLVVFVFHLLMLQCSAHFLGYNITIPDGYKVETDDSYVCTVLKLPEKGYKLIGVQPMADQAVVHHILLFGKYHQLVGLDTVLYCPVAHDRSSRSAASPWMLHHSY